MRCWRVCGAFSIRVTRRHSTLLLMVILIAGLTGILQLYASRHYDKPFVRHPSGDFEYRPGAFLQGVQPNDTVSYCQFNYGLPKALNWSTITVQSSPELGSHAHFQIIYNAIKGTAYKNVSQYDTVTYVTQATPEFLYHIVEIAKYWDGPISLAVFVPDYDLDLTMQIMEHLCHCYPGMAKVSLHLFYTKRFPPKMKRDPPFVPTAAPNETLFSETVSEAIARKRIRYKNLTNKTRATYIQNAIKEKIKRMMVTAPPKRSSAPRLSFNDCSGLESYDMASFRREQGMMYPINVGRNAARYATRTNYFLVSDIELVPSEGLALKFSAMLRKLVGGWKRDGGYIIPNTVFVVPIFEVERGERMPRTKEELVALVADNRANYFHQKICGHCQRFPGLQTWLKKPNVDEIKAMMFAKREYPYHRWEPLYFGTNRDPWYSENLFWEGMQDKMAQMLELCLQGYRMVILDGGFLCHAARDFQKVITDKLKNRGARLFNIKRYHKIIQSYKLMYPDRSQCRINYGLYGKS